MNLSRSYINGGFKEKLREGLIYYFSFFIWPFGVLIASMTNWKKSFSKNIFWIFCVFFGFAFIIGDDSIISTDSVNYAHWLTTYAFSDISFTDLFKSFYSERTGSLDILHPLITYLVSRVTYDPAFLFAVFGLIFGYFYSRNIWFILDKIQGKITPFLFLYILTFALMNPIWNINGFRMWTAAQIFLFGSLPYLLDGNPKRLIWSGVSVLMHFSFLLPLITLPLFVVLKNKINILFILFIITSFIKELDLNLVRNALHLLPSVLQPTVSSYTNPDYADLVQSNFQNINWYITYSGKGIEWVIYTMVIFVYFFCKDLLNNKPNIKALFCYSLLFYAVANILSLIPSGARFLILANSFFFAFCIVSFPDIIRTKYSHIVITLSVPLLLLFCVVSLRSGMDFYGLNSIIGNPFTVAFWNDTIPLIEIIKGLI